MQSFRSIPQNREVVSLYILFLDLFNKSSVIVLSYIIFDDICFAIRIWLQIAICSMIFVQIVYLVALDRSQRVLFLPRIRLEWPLTWRTPVTGNPKYRQAKQTSLHLLIAVELIFCNGKAINTAWLFVHMVAFYILPQSVSRTPQAFSIPSISAWKMLAEFGRRLQRDISRFLEYTFIPTPHSILEPSAQIDITFNSATKSLLHLRLEGILTWK